MDITGTETVLHTFHGLDGDTPRTPVVLDKEGNIYGTTIIGGAHLAHTFGENRVKRFISTDRPSGG